MWLSFILSDTRITQPKPVILLCDNLSAVHLTANPALHNRSKHFETEYHYVRERVAVGVLDVQHIPYDYSFLIFSQNLYLDSLFKVFAPN